MYAVAYYRVSTGKQESSGLGLEAQRDSVNSLVRQRGLELLTEYTETESGGEDDRPELLKAIAHVKRSGGLLLVAKLDRLARSVRLTAELMESKVEFVCCDNPYANKLTIHILAAVAEHERNLISRRTKEALAASKRRGVKLGANREGARKFKLEEVLKGARKAAKTRSQAAAEAYADLEPVLMQKATYKQIAKILNDSGHTTRTGRKWTPQLVCNARKKLVPPAAKKQA